MAIASLILGPAVKGGQAVAYPDSAGDVVYNRFTQTVPPSTAINAVLEIGVIPPGCRVVDAVIESSVVGAGVTGNVGIISDSRNPPAPPGSNSAADLAARSAGAEFFAAQALSAAAVARMALATGFQTLPVAYERGIGLTILGAVTAATPQTVTLGVWIAAA